MVLSSCIIAFLGPVGVGKSTQRQLVAQSLRDRGIKVSSTQLKALHLFCNFLIMAVVFLLREKSEKNHYRIFRNKRISITAKLFPIAALLDIPSFILRYWFTVVLPMKLGRVVLVEEYMYATLAEYLFLLKKMEICDRVSAIFILIVKKLMLKNQHRTLTIYLNASFCSLTERITARNTYTEDQNYIEMQQSELFRIAKFFSSGDRFFYIDTSNMDIKQVNCKVLPMIESVLML